MAPLTRLAGTVLPGSRLRREQVAAYARAWQEHDVAAPGPLWADLDASLLTCAVGANDLLRTRSVESIATALHELLDALPPGSVVATLPRGIRERAARRLNDLIWAQAPARGLRVADVWARTGPPWRGKYARDGFHPSDRGYRDWADAFLDVLDPEGDPTAP